MLAVAGAAHGDLSSTAYRVLGQPDLRQNGMNRVEGIEMHSPAGLALDPRPGRAHLYVADTNNHRILCWQDKRAFQNGDPPELILGQPSRYGSGPLGIGEKGFFGPAAVAVDPLNGNLYVADSGNHRVLRFTSPFDFPGRLEPDAVYGQPDFASTAAPAAADQTNLKTPRVVTFDSNRNLWIADTGFHRILRYPSVTLDSVNPVPDVVLGQADFLGGAQNRGRTTVSASGLDAPLGLAFDAENNIYVSDYNNARVLKFPPNANADVPATQVFGQADLTSRILAPQPSANSIGGPTGLAVGAGGRLYVTVPAENRVLVFATNASAAGPATLVFGQSDFTGSRPNADAFPLPSANSLFAPLDVKSDAEGNVYIADTGNNRLLVFAPESRTATRVLGQFDFASNTPNQVKAGGLNAPYKMVIDYSQTPFALYVADTGNHRVLVWKDSVRFRSGDPADLAIGQPNLRTAMPNVDSGITRRPSATSLWLPKGIAVDAAGNLYVADSGNNRVLRYPRPVDQAGRIAPDMVLGQLDFNTADSMLVSANSLRSPSAVATGPTGDIFVSDTGNHRVLQFPSGSGTGAAAFRVFGQPDFTSSTAPNAPSAQTLSSPLGIAVDPFSNLYVADTGLNRVMGFLSTTDAPAAGAAAAIVIGADAFDAVAAGRSATRLRAPMDVSVGPSGDLYVSDSGNHRVLRFDSLFILPGSGGAATAVYGQVDTIAGARNWDAQGGLTSGKGMSSPGGIFVDRRATLYVADTGNSRVTHFLHGVKVAHPANSQASALGRGGLASLHGSGLADTEESGVPPLPNSLANREVVLNDEMKAPVMFVGADQIRFQVPWLAQPGSTSLAVRCADTGELVAGASAAIASYAPGLFPSNGTQGGVFNEDGTRNSDANPATRGSSIKIMGTGQGLVTPLFGDGQASPADPPAVTVAVPVSDGAACLSQQPSVCVAIGNVFGEIKYSGLAAGEVGVWQLDVRIPTTAPPGPAVPLRAIIGGVPSNIITVAIR